MTMGNGRKRLHIIDLGVVMPGEMIKVNVFPEDNVAQVFREGLVCYLIEKKATLWAKIVDGELMLRIKGGHCLTYSALHDQFDGVTCFRDLPARELEIVLSSGLV